MPHTLYGFTFKSIVRMVKRDTRKEDKKHNHPRQGIHKHDHACTEAIYHIASHTVCEY